MNSREHNLQKKFKQRRTDIQHKKIVAENLDNMELLMSFLFFTLCLCQVLVYYH